MRVFGCWIAIIALLGVPALARADLYAGVRFPGEQNYFADAVGLNDSGNFSRREVIIGYGDGIQGELTLGFGSLKGEVDTPEEEERGGFSSDMEASEFTLGVAGFYPLHQGQWYRIDGGLRFTYTTCSGESDIPAARGDNTHSLDCSGFSIGPTVRGRWMITDYVALGPELTLKFTSLECDEEWVYGGETASEIGSSFSAWGLDCAVRLEFMLY